METVINNNKELLAFMFAGLMVVLIILSIIENSIKEKNKAMVDELFKKISNPFEDKIINLKNQLEKLKQLTYLEYVPLKTKLTNEINQLQKSIETEKNKIQIVEVDQGMFETLTDNKKIQDLANNKYALMLGRYLETLKSVTPSYSETKNKKEAHYAYSDRKIQAINKNLEKVEKAYRLYSQVIREINEAKSALSSAQTMEMFDLMSSNKAVSFLSTASTSSANSELRDVKRAIENLNEYLKELKNENTQKFEKIEVSDMTDLVVDLIFDLNFDFTSVLSLFSLSDASIKLTRIKSSLSPLGDRLEISVDKIKTEKEVYLSQLP